jgi:hypothetical protein
MKLWRHVVWYSGSNNLEGYSENQKFTNVAYLSQIWASRNQTTCMYLRPILILSSHLPEWCRIGFFTFSIKNLVSYMLCVCSLSHAWYILCPLHNFLLIIIIIIIKCRVQIRATNYELLSILLACQFFHSLNRNVLNLLQQKQQMHIYLKMINEETVGAKCFVSPSD